MANTNHFEPDWTPPTDGIISFKFSLAGGQTFSGTRHLYRMMDTGGTEVIRVTPAANGASTTALELYVTGTIVTSTLTIQEGIAYHISVVWDQTANEAYLYVDGTLYATNNKTYSFTPSRHRIGSCGSGSISYTYISDLMEWDDPTADLATAINDDLWVEAHPVNATANDSDWSEFGGGSSGLAAALSDSDIGTGAESTTDPSSFDINFEDRNDRLSGWAPDTVIGLTAFMVVSADVVQDYTLTLKDGTGTMATDTGTLTASSSVIRATSGTDSGSNALVGADIDDVNLTYAIT